MNKTIYLNELLHLMYEEEVIIYIRNLDSKWTILDSGTSDVVDERNDCNDYIVTGFTRGKKKIIIYVKKNVDCKEEE